ncbi:MAG: hypothetical protein IR158_09850 [Cellulomonas sp.]|uniref:hypothetical protein n=1 Tax=Cellulomonas sp. TaxID=40001 RepID=UPI0019DC723E|nr:hypothetical protein [Cellulomonas sp.]MBF0688053.1 hypothetical protein [Cellulomonas sp.]
MTSGPMAHAAVLAVVVVLGGCATQPPMAHIGPSIPAAACSDAFAEMRRAAADTVPVNLSDPDGRAIELIGLEGCANTEEWFAAAVQNPDLVGAADPTTMDSTVFAERCRVEWPELRGSRVCTDAIATGLVPD